MADGAGAVLAVLAFPVLILAIGMPFAFLVRLALGALGLL
jgi:hypothetical protein